MFKVLLIEDEFIIAKDIKMVLEKEDYAKVSIAKKVNDIFDLFKEQDFDLIISDVNLNLDVDGIEIVSELIKLKSVPVVYLTAYSDEEIISRAEKTSPFAYLLKPYNEKQLKITMNLAVLNHSKMLKNIDVDIEKTKLLELLTRREKEVLVVLSSGKISKEVADILNISVLTVEKHKQNIKAKLNLRTTVDMIKFTMSTKLFELCD